MHQFVPVHTIYCRPIVKSIAVRRSGEAEVLLDGAESDVLVDQTTVGVAHEQAEIFLDFAELLSDRFKLFFKLLLKLLLELLLKFLFEFLVKKISDEFEVVRCERHSHS